MANININEISQNYTYNIGNSSYACVALPITSSWGPGYEYDKKTGIDLTSENIENSVWNRFPATQEGLESFVSTYRGPATHYLGRKDFSYQQAMTLLTAGYDLLVCRVAGGLKSVGQIRFDNNQVLNVNAKYKGTFGNNLLVNIRKIERYKSRYWNIITYVVDSSSGTRTAVENINFVFDLETSNDTILHISEVESSFLEFDIVNAPTYDDMALDQTQDETHVWDAIYQIQSVTLLGGTDHPDFDSEISEGLENLLVEIQQALEDANAKNEIAQTKKSEALAKLDEANAKKSEALEQLSDANSKSASANVAKRASDDAKALADEAKDIANEKKAIRDSAKDARDAAQELKDSTEQIKNEAQATLTEKEGIKNSAQSAMEEAQAVKEATEANPDATEEEKQAASDAYDAAVSAYQQADEEYQTAQSAYDSANADYQSANSAYQQADEAYQTALGEYQTAKSDYDGKKAIYTELKAQYESAKQEYLDAQAEYEELQEAYNQLKAEYEALQEDYEAAKEEYLTAKAVYEAKRSAYSTYAVKTYMEAAIDCAKNRYAMSLYNKQYIDMDQKDQDTIDALGYVSLLGDLNGAGIGPEELIISDKNTAAIICKREWMFNAAYSVLNALNDKLAYNPNRIIVPGWDDQDLLFLEPTVLSDERYKAAYTITKVSPLHQKLMDVAYYSRCATAYIDIPRSLEKSGVYNEVDDPENAGYAQKLARLNESLSLVTVNGAFYASHSALFAPWGKYMYVGTRKQMQASPSFLALMIDRAMIKNQTSQYEWQLPSNRRNNLRIGKLDYTISKKYLDIWQTLEGVGVNCITRIPDIGLSIWGNSTLYEVPPATYQALANLSTRKLVNAVEDLAYRCGISITFNYNNDQAYNAFYAGMTPLLDTMRNVGAITDYYLRMAEDVNGLDQVNANSVIGKIYLVIDGVINDINIDLIALPPQTSLDEYRA